ncbi:MAG: inorganic phosphate transporter [Sphingobium sp.]|nr:MAG: inorganic phosphate transporter [Sphingobium sp.]
MATLLLLGALFLAFSNGANDNFKGFATVWGSHSLGYRKALALATIATIAGSLASLLLAGDLVQQFSGKGLVPDAVATTPAFIMAVGIGAAVTVIVATRTGFPISTTHALIGGLVGAGMATGGGVDLARLGGSFFAPLLISPVIAAGLGALAYSLMRRRRREADCACIIEAETLGTPAADGSALAFSAALPRLVVASDATCDSLTAPGIRFSIARLLDHVHLLSAASICFARGLNDTPKLAALLVAAQLSGMRLSVGLVALLMAAGGLLLARRVAETMSLRINHMDATQGVSANLITAALVIFASRFGMPVSTTHVSVGSIAGVGTGAGTVDWPALRHVLLSWVLTLPCAAGVAWAIATALHSL